MNTPDEAWLVILEIAKHDLTEQQIWCVSEGIKPLFRERADEFVQRANDLAATNPQFARSLLGIDKYVETQSEAWFAQKWLAQTWPDSYKEMCQNREEKPKRRFAVSSVVHLVLLHFCCSEPEKMWLIVLEILKHDLTEKQMLMLGVVELENLLARHAPDFIERVEQLAASDAKFAKILGAVWQRDMTEDIWQRIEKARSWLWP